MSEHVYTHRDVMKAAEEAIEMFLEYRDDYGYPEATAKARAIEEVYEGTNPSVHQEIAEMRAWQAVGESVVESKNEEELPL